MSAYISPFEIMLSKTEMSTVGLRENVESCAQTNVFPETTPATYAHIMKTLDTAGKFHAKLIELGSQGQPFPSEIARLEAIKADLLSIKKILDDKGYGSAAAAAAHPAAAAAINPMMQNLTLGKAKGPDSASAPSSSV